MTAGLVLVSTADTDLLAARASGVGWRVANPSRLDAAAVPALLDGAALVLVRLLGGRRTWPEGLAAVLAAGTPVVAVGGEATPDAELTALSTVPAGVAHDAQRYLVESGPDNLRELHRFLSDTVLLTGEGFAAPQPTPAFGVHGVHAADPGRPTVGVLFYRAHALSGNTGFVDVLCEAIEAAGANARAVYVPALCLTSSRQAWQDSTAALSPMDAAMQVAIPEFDGRLISVPFSFKEAGTDGIPGYVAYPERAARVAGIAAGYARLGHLRPARRRVAVVLSSYPTKHARVGNAVGLDTPASAVALLRALHDAGYETDGFPEDGDTLIHALIAAGGHDTEWLTEEQLAAAPARVPLAEYRRWFDALPALLRERMREHWGEPPGSLYVDGGDIVLAALRFGNVTLMIQPPRGFGENPIAIYH